MIYAVKILAVLFAAAHIVAVAAALPKLEWIGALLGGAIVCYAAYMNGKKSGKVNPIHHIVRAAVVALFTVGYIVW